MKCIHHDTLYGVSLIVCIVNVIVIVELVLLCNYSLTIVEPMIIEPPQDALQVVGRNVSFRCVAFGIPRPTITWMLTATDDTMMMLSGTSEVDGGVIRNELNLTNLTVQDFGVYSCIASNIFHNDMEMATLEQGSELFITTYYKRPSLLDVISHTNLLVYMIAQLYKYAFKFLFNCYFNLHEKYLILCIFYICC